MQVDTTLPEYDNILLHINKALKKTDTPIKKGDITLGAPEAIAGIGLDTVDRTNPNREYIYNTKLKVIPSAQYSYEHPTTVEYRRLDIGLQLWFCHGDNLTLVFTKDYSEYSSDDIKRAFCQKGKLREESITIVIEDTGETDKKKIRLYPIEDSLLYIGEYSHIVTFKIDKKSIPGMFSDPRLEGLEYHTP